MLFLVAGICMPFFVHGSVMITEIMYDPEGNDTGREWVEIWNDGGETVDISGWWFYEGSNHGFQNTEASVLPAGGYAIIADNPALFSADWPDISAVILDSSAFSLKNTGELIAMRDAEKNDVVSVSYLPEESADGNGASLQLFQAVWQAAAPTPGAPNESEASHTFQSSEPDVPAPNPPPSADAGWVPDNKNISVSANAPGRVIVGADSLFHARAFGISGTPLEEADYVWNFGDGTIKKGEKVLHAYKYPGEYVVFISVQSGKYSAADRLLVTAKPADIRISRAVAGTDSFVELENRSSRELNLSFWQLYNGYSRYVFPENTILLPNTKVIFPYSATGLLILSPSDVSLLYPNGSRAAGYDSSPVSVKNETGAPGSVLPAPQISASAILSAREVKTEEDRESEESIQAVQATSSEALFTVPVEQDHSGNGGQWLLGTLLLAFLSAGVAIFSRRHEGNGEDEYTVIEEASDTK